MPDERELDQLLDSALSRYGEPDAHLETRVLAHLAAHSSESAPARKRWLPWAIALPIAAGLILAIALSLRSAKQPAVQQARQDVAPAAQTAQPSELPRLPEISAHRPRPRKAAVSAVQTATHPSTPPKLDIFPTPHSLSPEELAMARFVANTPPAEIQATQKALQQDDQPLHIAAIVIQPIQIPGDPKPE